MAVRADDILDRRRLRRKLTFWRIAAIAAIVIAIAAASFWSYGGDGGIAADHVAKIRIEGTITEDDELLDRIERIGETDSVKGVIVWINSPGGTTAGGEAIFEALRKVAAEKPVVSQVGTLAASAGYMIASASDHIVARQSSIVGSIGVLVQFPDVTELMETIGVKVEGVKSSPLKAEPSPFTPTTDEERAMLRALVMDSYDWFVGIVEDRRSLTHAQTLALADGSIFTGRQAFERKLVDTLGGEAEAMAWLATKGVDAGLEVVEWKRSDRSNVFSTLTGADSLAQLLGFGEMPAAWARKLGADRLFLDGLLSLWQPDRHALSE